MDETKLKKIILLKMEVSALDNMIFEQVIQKKISSKYRELSKNQPVVIKIIGMEGEIMPSTIGNYIGMDKSTLTRMIENLEKKGMVFRKNDPEDRRKVLISLTEKGLRCYNHITKVIDDVLKLADDKNVDEYLQSLEKMVRFYKKFGHRQDLT
jgi:MarR family transcriptional regulator, organic hydroperoxide resistance regulator